MRELPPVENRNVASLGGEQTLVSLVDFFTPVVDDPHFYGGVAAAAALGRVYATGARPVSAVAIGGFPEDLDAPTVASIVRGGVKKCGEAGIPVVGSHIVKDVEPKFGFSVTGVAGSDGTVRGDIRRAGDVLILTKPLGVGILTAARREDAIGEDALDAAIESMLRLDGAASEAAVRYGAGAMAYVDGDGFLGRLQTMLGNRFGAVVDAGMVPLYPQALALAAHDAIPNATHANLRDARAGGAHFAAELPLGLPAVLCDAQTSGGLLIAVRPDTAGALLDGLHACAPASRIVGSITAGKGIQVVWRPSEQ